MGVQRDKTPRDHAYDVLVVAEEKLEKQFYKGAAERCAVASLWLRLAEHDRKLDKG